MEWNKAKKAYELIDEKQELIRLADKLQGVFEKKDVVGFLCATKDPISFAEAVSWEPEKETFTGLPFNRFALSGIGYMIHMINKEIDEIQKQIDEL